MEYQHSHILSPSAYSTSGLCDGIPVRRHNDFLKEETGVIRAQRDWKKYVGPVPPNYHGSMAADFSFVQITIPECLPERLEVISYADEFAFLYDDMADNACQAEIDGENDALLSILSEGIRKGKIESTSGKKLIQAQLFKEMLAIDPPRALTTLKALAAFIELGTAKQHRKIFESLEEYIPYRILDAGEMFWFGLVTFGMAITISPSEMDLCRRLTRSANIHFGLTSDLFSWEKECLEAQSAGRSNVVNAIFVLMQEHNCTVDEAKHLCRIRIVESQEEYLKVVEENKGNMALSKDLRKYLEALLYSMSGNTVWSVVCPRYNPGLVLSDRQLKCLRDGFGDTGVHTFVQSVRKEVATHTLPLPTHTPKNTPKTDYLGH